MTGDRGGGWWRPGALMPALGIVGPYFLNKLVYICFPGFLVFEATDYACRILSLALLYLLLRRTPAASPIALPIALPISWRLAVPSAKEFLLVLSGAIALIAANVVGLTFISALNAAIVVSTLIFAGIHWSYGVGSMAFAALAGLVFSVIFIRTRNLTAPVMIHAAYDTTVFSGGVAFLSQIYRGV